MNDEITAVSVASGKEGGVIQQRMWIVTPEVAEQVAEMLDNAGFPCKSALMDQKAAREFGKQHLVIG